MIEAIQKRASGGTMAVHAPPAHLEFLRAGQGPSCMDRPILPPRNRLRKGP